MLRYYPPEKQGLRHIVQQRFEVFPCSQILSSRKTRIKTSFRVRAQRDLQFLRYYPPEKQGLRRFILKLCGAIISQILSSRKTRIKTERVSSFRVRAQTQILSSRKTRIKTHVISSLFCRSFPLRYYPPEKQGLRPTSCTFICAGKSSQILSSRKTRIKTVLRYTYCSRLRELRYYPPEKQGLRPS